MTTLLSPRAFLTKNLSILEAAAAENKISGGYRLTEANSLYGGGAAGVSNAHGASLWTADFLMINAQYNSKGVNFHGGGDGSYNPYYTPIADTHDGISEIRPVYYGMLFINQIAPGPMYDVAISTSLNVTAYAVAGNDGATYVAIINKEPTAEAQTSIDLGAGASHASSIALSGPGLDALSGTTLGGSVVATDGSWYPKQNQSTKLGGAQSFTVNVPAASALLVKALP